MPIPAAMAGAMAMASTPPTAAAEAPAPIAMAMPPSSANAVAPAPTAYAPAPNVTADPVAVSDVTPRAIVPPVSPPPTAHSLAEPDPHQGSMLWMLTNGMLPQAEILERVSKEDLELIVMTDVSSLILLNWHLLLGSKGPC